MPMVFVEATVTGCTPDSELPLRRDSLSWCGIVCFRCKSKHCDGHNSVPSQVHTFPTRKSSCLIAEESFVVERNQREKPKKIGRKIRENMSNDIHIQLWKRYFFLKSLLVLFILPFKSVLPTCMYMHRVRIWWP